MEIGVGFLVACLPACAHLIDHFSLSRLSALFPKGSASNLRSLFTRRPSSDDHEPNCRGRAETVPAEKDLECSLVPPHKFFPSPRVQGMEDMEFITSTETV